jgi:hypothetical protein
VTRPPRVPGTPGGRSYRLEVATGGRPLEAYLRAVGSLPLRRGELWVTDMQHDDGCPGWERESIPLCTCEVVWLTVRRVA